MLLNIYKKQEQTFLNAQHSSVTQSFPTLCNLIDCSTMPGFPVHHQLLKFAQTHTSSRQCHPIISSSVELFSSCLKSFPALGSFQMSQFFASDGQSIEVSASASVLPMDSQDWFPLGWTGWILLSKGLSRVFSNTTVQKHQFFGTQLLIVQLSHPYMTTGKTIAVTRWTFVGNVNVSAF